MNIPRCAVGLIGVLMLGTLIKADSPTDPKVEFIPFAILPDSLGVAGPFAGVHNDALLVAGGANFPQPVWENGKVWRDRIHVLICDDKKLTWIDGGQLPRPIGYGASVSTPQGMVCMGGNDAQHIYDDVFLIAFDRKSRTVAIRDYPRLPAPSAYTSATLVGSVIYLVGGQTGQSLETATNHFWSLDLSQKGTEAFQWREHVSVPWSSRAFPIAAAVGGNVYVISGRRQNDSAVEFLQDVWRFTPETEKWERKADIPGCRMAGIGIAHGDQHLLVLGGADGSLFHRTEDLKDKHPGFPKEALTYDAKRDKWSSAGTIPANHVTTVPVKWKNSILIPSGEIRPRVRSPKIWQVRTTLDGEPRLR
jgi:N-acetylneuraminic acid mutarotase